LRRWIIAGFSIVGAIVGVLVVVIGTLIAFPDLLAKENLTVVSWGDSYQQAQTVALFHPFVDRTDIDLDATIYGGGLDEIRAQVVSGVVEWDVVDLDITDAVNACSAGLLEEIDPAMLPAGADGETALNDFVPGAVGPCWVGTVVYSQLVVYSPDALAAAPQSAADFFDLENFPGMRALRDAGPEYNIPFALIADGATADEVYAILQTEAGLDRAFAKLDSIKESLLWWRRPNEPIDMLAEGAVAMSTALNGRAFDAETAGADIAALWDGQLYGLDVLGIPKGTPARARALEFVAFASASAPLGQMSSRVPYGPARRSALDYVIDNPITGMEMRPFLPTTPENFRNALYVDQAWWTEHGDPIRARWDAWRRG
jgi:putative spermidine/putrescine transport system substrate-binding protein